MRGQVFRWEEKAVFGFMPSGKSQTGLIEYCPETGMVKCHECGDLYRDLGCHAARAHGLKAVEYRRAHGLRYGQPLCGPAESAKRRRRLSERLAAGGVLRTPESMARLQARSLEVKRPTPQRHSTAELRNERLICDRQLLARLAIIASELGRTPSSTDLEPNFLHELTKRYGSLNDAVSAIGLPITNVRGGRRGDPFTKAVLRELLMDFYVLNRRLPAVRDWASGSLPSMETFRRAFGSTYGAYDAAGLGQIARCRQGRRGPYPREATA